MKRMRVLKTRSIKRQLLAMMMATSSAAILLMAFLLMLNQAMNNQRSTQQQLIALADALGSISTGALIFDDRTAGLEILNALTENNDIIYAVIEQSDGVRFVEFGNHTEIEVSGVGKRYSQLVRTYLASVWADLVMNETHVVRGIYLENEQIGTIRIISTLDTLYAELLNFMVLVLAIAGICLLITFLIGFRLQKVIADPILNLQIAMEAVAEHRDYSLRVDNADTIAMNEFEALVDGFNHMLHQIQLRDRQLAEYGIQLEERVAKRSFQLIEANNKRIAWLEIMACFLKHELKNATVGIKTSLDLIERRTLKQQNIDVYLSRARASMTTMNALLHNAGDASTLEAVLYKEPHELIDLAEIVLKHAESYELIYPAILMTVDCQGKTPVFGNATRIKQLLDKLIDNAVEHTVTSSPIQVKVEQTPEQARLIVINRGDALPEDKHSLFDLFVSLRTAERKTADHLGLGLYIVRLIAESHGGQVVAYDLEGEETGAVFEVSFPL